MTNRKGIVPAVVTKKEGVSIVAWRNRLSLTDLRRGLSTTILFGEKHVPRSHLGDLDALDAPIADGGTLASHVRFAGEKYPLAETVDDAAAPVFGSWHETVTNFLLADGSVESITRQLSPALLARRMHISE
ncbi:MAG: H-X9-DG-CTERM domain-containing protein [Gemmataceae bacterium]